MKKIFSIFSYSLILTMFFALSAIGKFYHSPGKITFSVGFFLLALVLFLSFILLKYIPDISILSWLPLFVILSNLSVQLTGGISHSIFSPIYLFLIIIIGLKSERKGVAISVILIILLEYSSGMFKHQINFYFLTITFLFIILSFFISYFILELARSKKETEKKLKGIEDATSVLSTPASTSDRNEILTTLKNKKGGSDLKAKKKMAELIEPLLNVVFQTINSHSTLLFLREEHRDSFFLFLSKSHSAYINKNAIITQGAGTYNWVIKEKETLLNNQFLLDSTALGYYSKNENIRSIIIMPLLEESALIGFLICDSKEENKFNWEDKEKLKVFGNLIVSTLSLFKRFYWAQWDASRYSALHEIAKRLSQSLEIDTVLEILIEIAPQGFDFDLLILVLYDENEKPNIYKVFPDDKFVHLKGLEISTSDSLAGLVLENNQVLIKSKRIKTPFFSKEEKGLEHFQSFFGVPMHRDEEVSGELILMAKDKARFSLEKKEPVIFLADLISVALEKAKLYQQTKELSIRDGLTGAFNHKHFQDCLGKELQRSKRSGNPFSIMMFDIDHFKEFNDNYGHQIGDNVLKHISDIVKKNLRDIDIFARYGGEEFIIILPDTSKDGVLAVGEKLRLLIEKKPLIIRDNIYPVTVSIGCSVYPFDGEDKDTLIKRADDALYRAKQDGRNCVRTVSDGL